MKLSAIWRPGRATGEAATGQGITLQPYRGYGSRDEVFLIGRVFRQPCPAAGPSARRRSAQLIAVLGAAPAAGGHRRRARSARFGGAEQRVTTDRDGYFRVHLRPVRAAARRPSVAHDGAGAARSPIAVPGRGELFVPPPGCRYVVISDIDDTVMHTGVANKADDAVAAVHAGGREPGRLPRRGRPAAGPAPRRSGAEHNPMLYVSRGALEHLRGAREFFRLHGSRSGPLLFLREWGLTLQRPLPRRGKGHKLELIRNMLALYRDLPFVLIGDSGQRDPEIYAQVVREHPGRVLAIYIRNVSRDPDRHRAIEALAAEVAEAGSSLLLAADSLAMAEHAAAMG